MNDNPGPDFDTAGASESAQTDTASNGVAGPAAPANSTPMNPTLLNQWFFVQKVVSDPKLSRCAVACAFHLVDLYNKRLGRAWPSHETLAKLTGCHRRTVIDAVKRLTDLKYFEVDRGNGRRSNHYRPNFSLMVKETAPAATGDENATSPVNQTPPLQGVVVKSAAPYTSYSPVVSNGGGKEVSPRSAGSSALGAPSPSRGPLPASKSSGRHIQRRKDERLL